MDVAGEWVVASFSEGADQYRFPFAGPASRANCGGVVQSDRLAHNAPIHKYSLQECSIEMPREEWLAIQGCPVIWSLNSHHSGRDIKANSFVIVMFEPS